MRLQLQFCKLRENYVYHKIHNYIMHNNCITNHTTSNHYIPQ